MSIKDEQRHEDFSRLVWLDMAKYPEVWFLENRVPALGEVRGKAIIMGRFWTSMFRGLSFDIHWIVLTVQGPDDDSWDNGMGWRIPGWGPPVRDLKFDCGGTEGILQDWYTLSSFLQIPEKLAIVSSKDEGQIELTEVDDGGTARPAPARSAPSNDHIVRIGVRISPSPAFCHRQRFWMARVGIWNRGHQQSPGGMACPPIERWQKGPRDHANGFLPSDCVWR